MERKSIWMNLMLWVLICIMSDKGKAKDINETLLWVLILLEMF